MDFPRRRGHQSPFTAWLAGPAESGSQGEEAGPRQGRRGPREGRRQDSGRGGCRTQREEEGTQAGEDAESREGRMQDPGKGGGDPGRGRGNPGRGGGRTQAGEEGTQAGEEKTQEGEEGTQAGEERREDADPRPWEDLSASSAKGAAQESKGWYTVRSSLGEMEMGWLSPKSFFWENHQWFPQSKPPR